MKWQAGIMVFVVAVCIFATIIVGIRIADYLFAPGVVFTKPHPEMTMWPR